MGFYHTLYTNPIEFNYILSNIIIIIGPHELQHLVIEKRKHGICLPFKVSIKRFSRLAYVSRWDDDELKVIMMININIKG